MKFHNQRSFMGHEISNVNNKPLLRKKGKQWIVVAVSALILAGFGGMVSITTHADTTATQPTTTKVAPKPANNSAKDTTPASSTNNNTKPVSSASNTQNQAKALHINLLQNANAKKPSKLTTTNNNNNGNNSNNNSNKKPAVHLLSNTPSATPNIKARGKWGKAQWTLDNNGNLVISTGDISNGPFMGSYNNNDVRTVKFDRVQSHNSGIPEYSGYENLESVDYSGLSGNVNSGTTFGHGLYNDPNLQSVTFSKNFDTSNVAFYDNLFNGDTNLRVVKNFNALSTEHLQDYDYMFNNCVNLKSIDLSNFDTHKVPQSGQITYTNDSHTGSGNYQAFNNTPALSQVILGKNTILYPDSGIAPYAIPQGTMGTSFEKLDDGHSHANSNGTPRIWNLCKRGNWGTATWYLNPDTGDMLVQNNTLSTGSEPHDSGGYGNLLSETGMTQSQSNLVKKISFRDVSTPPSSNRLIDNENYNNDYFKNLTDIDVGGLNTSNTSNFFAMFCGLGNLQRIEHLHHLNMAKASDVSWMFGADPNLQALDLSNANIEPNLNDSDIFVNDNNLRKLKLGSNVSFDNRTGIPNNIWQNDNNDNNNPENITSLRQGSWNTQFNQYIDYDWNGYSKGNTTIKGNYGSTGIITGTGLNPGWHVNNNATYNDTDNGKFTFNGGHTTIGILPNVVTDTIDYKYDGNTIASSQAFKGNDYLVNYPNGTDKPETKNSVVPNTSFTITSTPSGLPAGYSVVNPNESFNYDGGTHPVAVTPIQKTDRINYMYNGHQIGSTFKSSGNDVAASSANNTSFEVTSAPANYHIASGVNVEFNFDGRTHDVSVAPNTVTVNYKNGTQGISSSTASYASGRSTYDNFAKPSYYNLASGQSNKPLSFNKNGNSVDVKVTPNQVTDTVNYVASYMNGSTKVSSALSTGNDYQAQSASNTKFTVSNAPANYQLVPNEDNTFNYDGYSHDVAVEPIQNNQKTDVLNYVNGDAKLASDVYTGNDMYAPNVNHTSFNANDYVPAGYHVVNDGGNTFYFDGQTHDVTVYPNSITLEFNNGQAGSKKIDNLKGTTYQIKSSDVPANYQLANSKDDVIDLGNLGKSTEYNVSVTPASDNIQPAPYIPSMPTSFASSASSVAYVPVSASSTISKPSNEAMPSHYRYTKVVTPLQLHTSKHFTKKNGVLTIKHPTSFKIMKIVHDHKLIRYEVKYQGRNYFITANDHFTINNYVQKHDFKSHKHMVVKVITPMIEYKHVHFSKKNAIKVFKKGAVLPVKKVFTIGKGEMTRFELTNGRFVTSNKLFVKVIK